MPAIDGSRILVAGGANRVGTALALGLAEGCADDCVSYHCSARQAANTRADIDALGRRSGVVWYDAAHPADMTAMVDAAADALGGLDVYIHCPSGGFEPRAPEEVDEPLWDTAVDSTAKGFMFAAQAAYRIMAEAGGGVIVAITDVA